MASPLGTTSLPLSPQFSAWNDQKHHESSWETDLFKPQDGIEAPTRATQSTYDKRHRYHLGTNKKSSNNTYDTPSRLEYNYEHRTSASPRRHSRHSDHRRRRGLEKSQRQSERSETQNILRGAEIIRAQIMSQFGNEEENVNRRMSSLSFSPSSIPVYDDNIVENDTRGSMHIINSRRSRYFSSNTQPVFEDNGSCVKQRHIASEEKVADQCHQHQRHHFHADFSSDHIVGTEEKSSCSYSSSSSPVSVAGINKVSEQNMSKEEQAAYRHAQKAGLLWLTIVGSHLRFPPHWFNGARSPPMDDPNFSDPRLSTRWKYGTTEQHLAVASARSSRGSLGMYVKNRRSAGSVLLHVIVRDDETLCPIRDISVGCYHPNARGVRKTDEPLPEVEDMRAVWIAVRKRQGEGKGGSFVDSLLTMNCVEGGEKRTYASPLGRKHSVSNSNVRAVFGDKAPVETLFLVESHLKKLMHREGDFRLPAMRMVAEFLF